MRENQSEPAELANTIAEAFASAGTHPAFVFAIRQTGFILTDQNMHLFDDEDIEEWEEALARWFEMHPDAPPLPEPG